jgi:serine/threonine-protein kinase HipA
VKRIFVWVRCADAIVQLVGELVTTEPDRASGHFESEFEYAPSWLTLPGAFALDPESLPLVAAQRFRGELFYPPLAVVDDALPDDWGRRLLVRAMTSEGQRVTPPDMLLRLRGGGTGALLFTPTEAVPRPDESLPSTALAKLLAAASKFEAGTLATGDEFRRLLEGSSRAGGARPKALVHDAVGEWLAKFPSRSRDAAVDLVGLEATCLSLARRAGLEVPDSRLQAVGARRALLVRRFDVVAGGGRRHMLSMRSLCRERPGVYAQRYTDVAMVLRRHSAAPAEDIARLFRLMAFNAAIGNVDDHLKNFWMLMRPDGFRLSPAFDLVPDIDGRGQHTLAFGQGFDCPVRTVLLDVAREWGVGRADDMLDEVIRATAAFSATARRLAVRYPVSLSRVAADVRRRSGLLRSRT